jgi:hypothetical protein
MFPLPLKYAFNSRRGPSALKKTPEAGLKTLAIQNFSRHIIKSKD